MEGHGSSSFSRRTGATPPPSPKRPELGHVIELEEGSTKSGRPQQPPPASPARSTLTMSGGISLASSSGRTPRGLLTFEQAEACFAAERGALLRDLAALQRLVEQKDAEKEKLVRKAAEAERLHRARMEAAARLHHQQQGRGHGGKEKGSGRSSSSSKRRVAALEEELAVLRAGGEEAARRHRAEKEALKGRVAELEHWVEATGSERAAMVALLRNGSEQCREVLRASEDTVPPGSPSSTVSSPGRRFRRQHLERVRALQGEFTAMLGRLQQIPSFATDVPTSPRRYHHHSGGSERLSPTAASPRNHPPKQTQFVYSGDEGEDEEARREWARLRDAHAAGQRELAKAKSELARVQGELAAARATRQEPQTERRARSLSPRRAPKSPLASSPLASPSSSPRRRQGQGEKEREARWEALAAVNRRVQDRLEGLLLRREGVQEGRGGVFPEIEELIGQGASLFYELATRLQALGEAEEGSEEAERGVEALAHDYGQVLAHARRLLVAAEQRARAQEEVWALLGGFFREACGVPGLPDREEELRRVLATCRRDILAAKDRAAAAASAAAPAPPSSTRSCPSPGRGAKSQEHEGLLLLQRAVESVLHTHQAHEGGDEGEYAAMGPEALALLLRERWLALGEAAGEGRRIKREKEGLAKEVAGLQARVVGLQEQLGRLQRAAVEGTNCNVKAKAVGETATAAAATVNVLRGALLALLGEVSDEPPPPSAGKEAPQQLVAAVQRGLVELKGALVQIGPPSGAAAVLTEGRRLIDLLDDHLRACTAQASRLQRDLQAARAAEAHATAAATAASEAMPPSAAARRLGEVEAAVLEALELLCQPPVLLRRGHGGGAVVDLPESLRRAIGAVKEEVRARGLEAERGKKEAQAGKRALEAERGELRSEVALLRRVLMAYEAALHEALAGAEELGLGSGNKEDVVDGVLGGEEEEEERQQQALAVRLRRHVHALRRLADQRAADIRALEQAAAAERAGLLEEQAAIKERASLHWRLARSLRDAARTVLGLAEAGGCEEEGMEVEEVKALCIRLLQYGARSRGQLGERAEEAGRWGERLADRERECQVLREKLRTQSAELGQLRDKVSGSFEEVATLRQRLAAQEADVEGLVGSLARVTEKLGRLQQAQQAQGVGQGGQGKGGKEQLHRSSALALHHQHEQEEEDDQGPQQVVQASSVASRSLGSSHGGNDGCGGGSGSLLSSVEDPLHAILTRGRGEGAAAVVAGQRRRTRLAGVGGEGDEETAASATAGLEADLRRARAGRKALQVEVKRLQGLVEEQHKTINALAARNAALEEELEAAEAAVAAAAGGGTGAAATMCTVDLEALQAEHDAMAQELQFLRESSRKREAEVRASIAQLQQERAALERRLRRQSQTVEELQALAAARQGHPHPQQHAQQAAVPAATSPSKQQRRGSA